MKYKILLIGRNKVLMEDFFLHLEGDFEMQTSSMRYLDISSHITYFKPDVLMYCMNKEEQTRTDIAMSLNEIINQNKVTLILTGNLDECERFQRMSGGMGELILKKPITVRSIRDRVVEFMDEKRANESVKEEAPEPVKAPVFAEEPKPAKQPIFSEEPKPAKQPIFSEEPKPAKQPIFSEEPKPVKRPVFPTVQKPVSQENGTGKKHILVVDDNAMMLRLLKEQLKEQYDVATAISGKIALKFLESRGADLVLLDYEMPNEDGAQILEQIRTNPSTANLPVVFLTGVTEKEKVRKIVGFKPQGYLVKPIESEVLFETIHSIIG